ncbi:MAG: ferritin-like domain-containing protein [Phycisphaerales bacterium]|nr:ferritin-like domain-containing protein [Phycisphaerales bacterium]
MKRDDLIAALNRDLEGEFQAVLMYVTYAANATGPHRPMLKQFFASEVPEELAHAQFLADKIVALGGTPTAEAAPVPEAKSNREMLEAVLKAERAAAERYTVRSRQAEAFGDKGLQVQLEDMVRDESQHRDETARILQDWGL